MPSRTFRIGKWYFPVCSRCTGVYLGIFLCYLITNFLHVNYTVYLVCIATVVTAPTFIDAISQLFGFRESNNVLRFSTGLLAGFGLVIIAKSIKLYLGIHWSLIS
ncbi:DUF2085 domain-containing protein [Methanobacterium spitsbergense]|uniref:DUF2085 domain-containing protein n=1 Tax=Methanobacterium spitsbergense TaxID=2874285 RepID=UPI002101E785|nr:DUF2085 domain-containing protein [Methanobacterium spitsbergense]